MELNEASKKDYRIIRHTYDIELNGKIYYIPDKYLENTFIPIEQKKLYKYIIVLFLDNHLNKNTSKNTSNKLRKIDKADKANKLTKLTKVDLLHYLNLTDKLFSYLVTGKLYINTNILSTLEKQIIDKIPQNLVNQLNLMIVEKLD
jgi:hypothetical protein